MPDQLKFLKSILMCKFTLYFKCKCPSVSLVNFLEHFWTPYHCLEMLFCCDYTWGFSIPFPFSQVGLCSFHCHGGSVGITQNHVASYYQWARLFLPIPKSVPVLSKAHTPLQFFHIHKQKIRLIFFED